MIKRNFINYIPFHRSSMLINAKNNFKGIRIRSGIRSCIFTLCHYQIISNIY